MAGVLDVLRASPQALDWFLVSPAIVFGSHAPGEATGHYRVGGDVVLRDDNGVSAIRSEEHTSELQSLMRNSYAVFCLKKKKQCITLNNTESCNHHFLVNQR